MPFKVIEVQFQTNVGVLEADMARAGAATEGYAGRVSGSAGRATSSITGMAGGINQAAAATEKVAASAARGGEAMHTGFSRAALAASLMSGNLNQVVQVASGFFAGQLFVKGLDAIVSGIGKVISSGINMNETLTKTGFAFGNAKVLVTSAADQMAGSFGVAKQQFIDGADSLGLIGKAAGLASPAAAAFGVQFQKLALDVRSFYHVPIADALLAIRSGLVGQERPLRQYGVLIDNTAVKAEGLALGLVKGGEEMDQQQKVMARASLIVKGFADAQGDLGRTMDQNANRLNAVRGNLQNIASDLGMKIQPAIGGALTSTGEFVHVLESTFGPTLTKVGGSLAGIGDVAVHVGGDLTRTVGSVVGLGAALTLPGLGLAADLLSGLTHIITENQVAVDALTVVILSRFVPALLIQAQTLGFAALAQAGAAYSSLAGAVTSASTAVSGAAASAGGVGAAFAGMAQWFLTGSTAAGTAARAAIVAATAEEELTISLVAQASAEMDAAAANAAMASGLMEVAPAAQAAAAGETEMAAATSLASGSMIAMLGPIALVAGEVLVLGRNYMNSAKDVKGFIDQAQAGKNLSTPQGLTAYIASLKDLRSQLGGYGPDGPPNWLEKKLGELGHDPTTVSDETYGKAGTEITKAQQALQDYNQHVADAAVATGLTSSQVEKLAQAAGVNLVTAGRASIDILVQMAHAAAGAAGSTDLLVNGVLTLSNSQQAIAGNLKGFDPLSSAMKADAKTAKSTGPTEADSQNKLAQAYISVDRAQMQVTDSKKKLDDLQNGGLERELAGQERTLAGAIDSVTRSQNNLIDAEQKLADLRANADSGRSLEEAQIAVQRAKIHQDQADLAEQAAQKKADYAKLVALPEEVRGTQDDLRSSQLDQKDAAFATADAQLALNRAQGDNGTIARGVADAQANVASATRDVADNQDAALVAQQKLNDLMSGGQTQELAKATLDWRDALQGVLSAQNQVVDAMKKASDSGTDTAAKPKASLADYMKNLASSTDVTKGYYADLATISARGGNDILDPLTQLGEDGTKIVHDLATSSKADFADMHDKISYYSITTSETFKKAFIANLTTGHDVSNMLVKSMVDYIGSETGMGADRVSAIMAGWVGDVVTNVNKVLVSVGEQPLAVSTSAAAAAPVTQGYGNIIPGFVLEAGPASGGIVLPDLSASGGGFGNAAGNIVQFLSSGALMATTGREDHKPQIAKAGDWRIWAEPETGGEAYVPRRGDPARALPILDVAAGWYGAKVTKNAKGSITLPNVPDYGAGELARGDLAASSYMKVAVGAALSKIVGAAVQSKLASIFAPAPPGGQVPGNVSEWLSAALKLTNTDGGWAGGLGKLVMAESHGNPHAYNPTVVHNGRNGDEHAMGLLQMLPSTFRAHMLSGHGDIWNPIDNASSAIGYIKGRYGSVYNTPLFKGGKYGGYADGGITFHDTSFDTGGTAKPGWNAIYNGLGRDEHLMPVHGGGSSVTFNSPLMSLIVKVEAGADLDRVGRVVREAVRPEIQAAMDRLHAQIGANP